MESLAKVKVKHRTQDPILVAQPDMNIFETVKDDQAV